MNGKRLLLLAGLLALAAGCAAPPAEEAGEGCCLYYSALDDRYAPLALDCEPYGAELPAEPVPALVRALLDGPETPGLSSPFPEGVRLLDWALEEEGVLHLDLSEQYGGLTGVDLTVADACLTLTLCQVEGVESVYVTVEGRDLPYRPVRNLGPGALLLSDGGDGPAAVTLSFWYPRSDGSGLGTETRELAAGDGLLQDVLTAWAEGPGAEGLEAALPRGAEVRSVALGEDGLCQVDLSPAFSEGLPGDPEEARLAVYALVNTLAEVEGVEAVQLLTGGTPLGQPLTPDPSLAAPAP